MLLAHDQHLMAIARPGVAIAAGDLDLDAARHRVEQGGAGRACGHVDFARTQRRDHLAAGVEDDAVHIQPFLGEIALLDGDEDGEIAGGVGDGDIDLVGGVSGARRQRACGGHGQHMAAVEAEQSLGGGVLHEQSSLVFSAV